MALWTVVLLSEYFLYYSSGIQNDLQLLPVSFLDHFLHKYYFCKAFLCISVHHLDTCSGYIKKFELQASTHSTVPNSLLFSITMIFIKFLWSGHVLLLTTVHNFFNSFVLGSLIHLSSSKRMHYSYWPAELLGRSSKHNLPCITFSFHSDKQFKGQK